jgi:IS30 family transposase
MKDDRALIALAKANTPLLTIAKNLNRPMTTIIRRTARVRTVDKPSCQGEGQIANSGRWPEGKEMKSIPWSRDEDERLRSLARSGLSLAQIADELQRRKSSVQARAKRMKIAVARDRNPMQAKAKK